MDARDFDYSKTYKAPASNARCYACDADAVGVAFHNGKVKDACKRHADSKAKTAKHCIYCDNPTRRGAVVIDGDEAHRACVREEERRNR